MDAAVFAVHKERLEAGGLTRNGKAYTPQLKKGLPSR
jgi:hypothetical protein